MGVDRQEGQAERAAVQNVAVLSPIFSLDLQTCCTGIFHISLALT